MSGNGLKESVLGRSAGRVVLVETPGCIGGNNIRCSLPGYRSITRLRHGSCCELPALSQYLGSPSPCLIGPKSGCGMAQVCWHVGPFTACSDAACNKQELGACGVNYTKGYSFVCLWRSEEVCLADTSVSLMPASRFQKTTNEHLRYGLDTSLGSSHFSLCTHISPSNLGRIQAPAGYIH